MLWSQKMGTYDTSVVLEVEENAVRSLPWLALSDNNSGHDLLPQFWLSLLDGGHNHVTNTGSGKTVQAGTGSFDGDDVEISGTGVVTAVHNCTTMLRVHTSVQFEHITI